MATKVINVSKDKRILVFKIVEELKRKFETMSYNEQLAFVEKYPEFVKRG